MSLSRSRYYIHKHVDGFVVFERKALGFGFSERDVPNLAKSDHRSGPKLVLELQKLSSESRGLIYIFSKIHR